MTRPRHVADFFAEYARIVGPTKVLDPFAVSPVIAIAVAGAVPAAEVTALCPSKAAFEAGRHLEPKVDWQLGDLSAWAPGPGPEFDLIVASPPTGKSSAPDMAGGIESLPPAIRNDSALLFLCMSGSLLRSGGHIAFQLGERTCWGRTSSTLASSMASTGLFLEASIALREGFAPASNGPSHVAVYGAGRSDQIFVAEVSPTSRVDAVIANLQARKSGSEMEFGALVDADLYRGWANAKAAYELERSQAEGPDLAVLGDAMLEASYLRLDRDEPEPSFENAFLLPQVGLGPARLHIDWESSPSKTRRVVAVELDPDKAIAEFVTQWLNGPQGKLARRSITVGEFQPHFSRTDLPHLPIPLPALKEQLQAIEIGRKIRGTITELEVLDEGLASATSAESLDKVEHELEIVLDGDDLEAWVRRVPFPLASILQRYLSEGDARGQIERLLFFFEACAEYFSTILLSSAHRTEELWGAARKKLAQPDRRPLLKRADFGSWVHIGQTVSKGLRRDAGSKGAADNDEGATIRTQLLGLADRPLYVALANRDVWKLLDGARDIRNRVKGHGGDMSGAQRARVVGELEELLGRFHLVAGRSFDGTALIQPGASTYDGGVYRFESARELTGPNAVFRERAVTTTIPLNGKSLYVVDRTRLCETAIELLPFVRLHPSPETEENACYFYSSTKASGDYRFVSYHFPGDSDFSLAEPELQAVIDAI